MVYISPCVSLVRPVFDLAYDHGFGLLVFQQDLTYYVELFREPAHALVAIGVLVDHGVNALEFLSDRA